MSKLAYKLLYLTLRYSFDEIPAAGLIFNTTRLSIERFVSVDLCIGVYAAAASLGEFDFQTAVEAKGGARCLLRQVNLGRLVKKRYLALAHN